ncbi:EthD family reductase [Nocardia sp. NPDC049707]|uniref:EthD family reductase n=1 Tax=Nocardia sp. NPDC049707 TaxID=3154735 RepID=UPI00344908F5
MSYEIAVCYGRPDDPAAFDDYYVASHIPLAIAVPGLAGFSWSKCTSLDGGEPPYYAIAHLAFETEAALREALSSPEMKAAGRDVRNFATGGVTMYTEQIQSRGKL